MAHSNHGIVKDSMGQDQPADKRRARTAHKTNPAKARPGEATRDPRLSDDEEKPGTGVMPDGRGDRPTG